MGVIEREKRTVRAMVEIYCADHHGGSGGPPCDGCRELLEYSHARLARCPYGEEKPSCKVCPIHCYKPAPRERMREVMRYAGPRMLWRHPWLAIAHLWQERTRRDAGKKSVTFSGGGPRVKTVIAAALMVPALSAPQAANGQAAAPDPLHERLDRGAAQVMPRVIAWRRDLHAHPELGNREVRTAGVVAEHLRRLGLEVRTGVGRTGVVGVLRGGKPGRVVALRADMDALPVTEETGLEFASKVRAEYNGREVGVMHACGHDAHTSMLMGAAEVLAGVKADLPGTVVFVFQPAEEGAPAGEDGGAAVMIAEGALDDPKVEAIFGLHVFPFEAGAIAVRPGGFMAAGDTLEVRVRGRQTHGALPWQGVDPIVVGSQIVLGLQTIVSRQSDLTSAPAVITLGIFQAGNRSNIIPDEARLVGTIRTFDQDMRGQIHERVTRTARAIAEAAGASAEVTITPGNPITHNDPTLTARMTPALSRVTARFIPNPPVTTTSEDFSEYQLRVPGVFFFLGVAPRGADPSKVEPNHSPRFMVEEEALVTGVRALASVAADYLRQ